jgi:large-conductance mechanosensitive channel
VRRIDFSTSSSTSPAGLSDRSRRQGCRRPDLNYGCSLNTVVDFLIVAFAVFLVVRKSIG